MKRFLTITALLGTVALGACSVPVPKCSNAETDHCGHGLAYSEERTVPVGQRAAPAPEPEPVVIAEPEPEPMPEPAPEPEPMPEPEPDDSQVMQKADEPTYMKGMSK